MTTTWTKYSALAQQTIENDWVSAYVRQSPLKGQLQRHPQFIERMYLVLDQATGISGEARALRDVGANIGLSAERARQILLHGLQMGARIRSEHIRSISDITVLMQRNDYMMAVLRAARKLALPDWMIGAGFVRNFVWGILHGYVYEYDVPRFPDIDLIYYDPSNREEAWEKKYEATLQGVLPVPWSVKNQARMHVVSGGLPYTSSTDALSHWPETATCVAVTLNQHDRLRLIAPLGADDLLQMVASPNPKCRGGVELFRKRMAKKRWQSTWPMVRIIDQS